MNLFLRDYYGGTRLVRVKLVGQSLCLGEDGYSVPLAQINGAEYLGNGDILTIAEDGVAFRLYSNQEHDAAIFITGHCNSNCIMCPTSDGERQTSYGLPDEALLAYVDMLPADVTHIAVTGGEPTLRPALFLQVMSKVAARFPGKEVLLLTNGRSLSVNSFFAKFIENCPPHLCVAVPLHGDTAELHDCITRAPGSFKQTDRALKNLLQANIPVEIRVVITKLNYLHLGQIADRIIESYPTARTVNFIGLETRGNCAKNFSQVYLGHRKAFMAMKSAVNKLIAAGINVSLYNFPLCSVDAGYWEICRRSISPEKIRYPKACASCQVKKLCGGFFNTTFSMVKPKVRPIQKEKGSLS
ncbi:His-Xaa-Ser system radical SAM maturase HxsC [uncultured Mitsuokella sp.]|uniref:His-Xaa-Ser system radical SAM maturase HxsC n=1 Tax=uncultured Mitsuokella sp. TaxID=453120 RepID=UPI00266FC7F8|nr:His-Xaa-Ser system radical SAM maturase HxsC [uncultured Mitsuokella sp.]